MTDEELIARLRDEHVSASRFEAADRIKALTEQLTAAQEDAKEAEDYAEHCGVRKGIKPGTRLGNHRKPIRVGPHQWPSISAMALDLGVNRRLLGYQLKLAPHAVLALVMRKKG